MAEKKELAVTEEKVVEIEMERLRSFENHPFKVKADSQMIELQESVKKYGILNPLIVRPRKDGTYEIISGHRRKFAAEKIGYRKMFRDLLTLHTSYTSPLSEFVRSKFFFYFIFSIKKRCHNAISHVSSFSYYICHFFKTVLYHL